MEWRIPRISEGTFPLPNLPIGFPPCTWTQSINCYYSLYPWPSLQKQTSLEGASVPRNLGEQRPDIFHREAKSRPRRKRWGELWSSLRRRKKKTRRVRGGEALGMQSSFACTVLRAKIFSSIYRPSEGRCPVMVSQHIIVRVLSWDTYQCEAYLRLFLKWIT